MISLLALLLALQLPDDSSDQITTDGIGPFHAGQSLSSVRNLLDTTVPQGNDDTYDCAIYPARRHYALVMVRKGKVARVSIDGDNRGYITPSGITLRSREATLKQVYGSKLRVQRDPYGDHPGDRWYYLNSTSGNGIRFVVHGGYVTEIIAGDGEAIQFPEGCN